MNDVPGAAVVPSSPPSAPEVLRVEDLRVDLAGPRGDVRVLAGVSLSVARGETLALVGPNGAGKSTLALALLRLLPPGARIAGRVLFEGRDLLALDEEALASVRGRDVGLVFQDPLSALDPLKPVGEQVAEPLLLHRLRPPAEAREAAIDLLARVGIPEPRRRARDLPHRLSGGMRQRVLLAAALSAGPRLLLADEPTSSLDPTTQASLLVLLRELCAERGLSVLLVTHDLGVVAELADRVAVLDAGRVVESGDVRQVLRRPGHPTTRALLAAAREGALR